ncbi:unnamed protein product, partial [marine sediment metagenome]
WVQVEHDALTQAARKAADKAVAVTEKKDTSKKDPSKEDLAAAAKGFEQSLADWRKVLDKYPSAIADKNIADELMMTIDSYKQILKRQDKKLPEKFILQDVVDRYGKPKSS